jgi:hypothetical protein
MSALRRASLCVALLVVGLFLARGASAQEAKLETRFRAEITGPQEIHFTLTGAARPARRSAYRLTDGQGGGIPIAEVRSQTDSTSVVIPARQLDPMRVHYLEIPRLGLRTLVRRDPLFRKLSSSKPLGAVVSADGSATTFRVFSPRAQAVRLHLYRDKDDAPDAALRVVEMTRDDDGVWEAA